ncbi:MAG: NADH-quinone oxidoreductase subunit K [Candidatus Cyclobacteriaceae bacterium M3_2C_046]
MILVLSVIIGLLFWASIYLMFHRSFFKLIVGIYLFGYATIFFLFTVTGITKNEPPLLNQQGADHLTEMADPLPQALTLTAIVIAIGVQLFVIILLKKVFENVHTEDLDNLKSTDKID